jgi:hypothetical protein
MRYVGHNGMDLSRPLDIICDAHLGPEQILKEL